MRERDRIKREQVMNTRNRGKRLASGITAAVGVGSLATAGVAAAAVYSSTPSVVARSNSSSSSTTPGTAATPGGSSKYGGSGTSGGSGSSQDNTRRSRGYGSTSPVQPGNGSTVHGRSSGS